MLAKFLKLILFFSVLTIVVPLLYSISFAHNWMAPKHEADKINPVIIDPVSTGKGKVLFMKNCRNCHGIEAVGLSKKTTGLNKKTPNLLKRLKTHTDGDFHWKIRSGKGEMPSFQDELSANDIWDIINYFKSIRIK